MMSMGLVGCGKFLRGRLGVCQRFPWTGWWQSIIRIWACGGEGEAERGSPPAARGGLSGGKVRSIWMDCENRRGFLRSLLRKYQEVSGFRDIFIILLGDIIILLVLSPPLAWQNGKKILSLPLRRLMCF